MCLRSLLISCCLVAGIVSAFAQPAYNPYTRKYPAATGHWTDSLRWQNITNVQSFGAIANDTLDDSASVAQAIAAVSAQGGGVLWFPAGTYVIKGNLTLKTGVVLRGDDPAPGLTNKQAGWVPPSKLEFPKYRFDTTAFEGRGYPNSMAFKSIRSETTCRNAGVVNLDVNRATIYLRFATGPVAGYITDQPITDVRNILVFGVRSNNTAEVDPGIPAAGTPMRPWQRMSFRHTRNISVNATANALIAGCRINDSTTDNFLMSGFLIKKRGTNNYIVIPDSNRPVFSYTDHYGIAINRGKGTVTYATPETEPYLFARGVEVRDNWIYKTSRVAIITSGLGHIIRGNIMRDDSTKLNYTNMLGPNGLQTAQGATTMENRGIDFSGWKVVVDSNDVLAYRHRVGGYLTTDGEGILLQECCGGTSVNDYVIKDNITHNYIGVYKMRDITNIQILNNRFINNAVYVNANTNGAAYFLNSCRVEGNTGLTGITMTGSQGGTAGVVRNNVASSSIADISASCHIVVENNTGFRNVRYFEVDPNNPNPTRPLAAGPCAADFLMPIVAMQTPVRDTNFCDSAGPMRFAVTAKLTSGVADSTQAKVLLGTSQIAQSLSFNPNDSLVRFAFTPPTGGNGDYFISFIAQAGSRKSFSDIRRFTRNCPVIARNKSRRWLQAIRSYPQPVKAGGAITLSNLQSDGNSLEMFDLQGKAVGPLVKTNGAVITYAVSSALVGGIYVLRVANTISAQVVKVVVE